MRFVFWALVTLLALVLAVFAATNRQGIALGLWPLPYALDLPIYLAVLGALLIGFVTGAFFAWLGGGRWRREARACRRRLAAVESELAAAQARLSGTGEGTALPARG